MYANEAQEVCREATFTERTSNSLGELNAVQQETYERLSTLYARLLGSRGEPPPAPTNLKSVASHSSAEIGEALSTALNRAHGLNALVGDLSRAL